MILVSACLAHMRTRYDGTSCPVELIARLVCAGKAVPVCPELLGGLPVPREAARIEGGGGRDVLCGRARVLTLSGKDVTGTFLEGARAAFAFARALGARGAVLKSGSPSCGSGEGPMEGVTTALLRQHGIRVYSEDDEWTIEPSFSSS